MTILEFRGNGKVERINAVKAIGASVVAEVRASVGRSTWSGVRAIEIEWGIGRASLFDTPDNLPVAWICECCGVGFVSDADLARASAMNSSVGSAASREDQRLN